MCSLQSKTGKCRAYFEKYYYDINTGTCEIFIYGGCQANGNNFDTEEECYARCGKWW